MMKTIVKPSLRYIFGAALILMWAGSAMAADRMYFGGFNQDTDGRTVLLVWGDLEGSIPSDITEFRIYRKIGSGNFDPEPLAVVPNDLVSQAQLGAYFDAPGEEAAKAEIIAMLDDMVQDTLIDDSNYLGYLYNTIDDSHPDFSRFKQMLLSRFSKHVARALGRVYVDETPGTQDNTYMITAVVDGQQIKPLGKTTVPVASETILPAPENFRKVEIGGCSDVNRFMDHEKIHFNWDVPATPQTMALRTMIYGYDIYRSETDRGALDLRDTVPEALTRINPVPIVASGNTAADGADAFLASDGGRAALNGDLNQGDTLYYYLVARDLSGRYSLTQGPLEAVVPDRESPVMPWNAHAQQEMDAGTPRMTLIWDRINADNYKAYYTRDKAFCATSPAGKVCYTKPGGDCNGEDRQCTDIAVSTYRIFRFDSFEGARNWGTDSDGDGWPDDIEEGGGYDPCNSASVPIGLPNPLIATFPANTQIRTLADSGKEIHYYRDPAPAPNNKVFWYRIAALDDQGNVSPLTPPVRAALWDRTQPEVTAEIRTQRCTYTVKRPDNRDDCLSYIDKPQPDDVFYVIDATPRAAARSFQLFEHCVSAETSVNLIYAAPFQKAAAITQADLANYSCADCIDNKGKISGYVVRYFGENGRFLAQSDLLTGLNCFDGYGGCVILQQDCTPMTITPDDPVIHPVDPLIPLNVCVNLTQGQCARVYRMINGNMTPITTWCFDAGSCSSDIDLRSIVTTDICLGVRVFSENGVGSPMTYFNCIPVLTLWAPKAPLMEGVTPTGEAADPSFEVRWSSQSEGIAAFIVKRESEAGIHYETLWDLTPDENTGQFSATISIEPETIEIPWCYSVRAMDTTLTMSDWSDTRCNVWGSVVEGESLGWPHVKTPVDAGEVVAVIPPSQTTPMLILSDALDDRLDAFGTQCPEKTDNKRCPYTDGYDVPRCGKDVLSCFDPSGFCCDICGVIRSWNTLGTFMVYRQEEGKAFIQVSPLVETIHCTYDELNEMQSVSTVNDPLVHMVTFDSSLVTANCSNPTASGDINATTRLVFGDWFPYQSGKRVRYKVLVFGDQSKEPEKVYTSGWLKLP